MVGLASLAYNVSVALLTCVIGRLDKAYEAR